MTIPGNDLLSEIENQNPKLGIFLRNYVMPTIARTAQNAGVDQTTQIQPPEPPASVKVTTSGEMLQITVDHNAPIIRGARYFSEISANDPSFSSGPMVHDHGASRSPATLTLPTKDASGNAHKYYVASYVQYPGGPPSKPTYYGGGSPTPITLGGTTQMDIQPGTGSGTANSSSPRPFEGLGSAPVRH